MLTLCYFRTEQISSTWRIAVSSTGRNTDCIVPSLSWDLEALRYFPSLHVGPSTLLTDIQTLWQRQTKDFGHTRASEYSVLILDNRGVGESDKPMMRYSTSEMAKDVIEILDELGWTAERELNIVGISMGGMIAQEIVRLPPAPVLFCFTICFFRPRTTVARSYGSADTSKPGLLNPHPPQLPDPPLHRRPPHQHHRLHRKPPQPHKHVHPQISRRTNNLRQTAPLQFRLHLRPRRRRIRRPALPNRRRQVRGGRDCEKEGSEPVYANGTSAASICSCFVTYVVADRKI